MQAGRPPPRTVPLPAAKALALLHSSCPQQVCNAATLLVPVSVLGGARQPSLLLVPPPAAPRLGEVDAPGTPRRKPPGRASRCRVASTLP
jgi:hypothetical protein